VIDTYTKKKNSVCSISAVRLWDLVEQRKRADFTFDNVSIAYLTCIEVNAAIVCACCMTLKPFVTRVFPRLWGGRSSGGSDVDGEAAGAGAAGVRGRAGPPTIGSKPSRRDVVSSETMETYYHGAWSHDEEAALKRGSGSSRGVSETEDEGGRTDRAESGRKEAGYLSIETTISSDEAVPREPPAARVV